MTQLIIEIIIRSEDNYLQSSYIQHKVEFEGVKTGRGNRSYSMSDKDRPFILERFHFVSFLLFVLALKQNKNPKCKEFPILPSFKKNKDKRAFTQMTRKF